MCVSVVGAGLLTEVVYVVVAWAWSLTEVGCVCVAGALILTEDVLVIRSIAPATATQIAMQPQSTASVNCNNLQTNGSHRCQSNNNRWPVSHAIEQQHTAAPIATARQYTARSSCTNTANGCSFQLQ